MPSGITYSPPPATHRPRISRLEELVFGKCPQPVSCGFDLNIGAGTVYPEINFTLPPMLIDATTWPTVRTIYDRTIDALLSRACDLGLRGLVVEFEQLPPMTARPAWGAELTRLLKDRLAKAHAAWGLAGALRVTIVDLRDEERPPQRRSGRSWERMRAALEECASAGADILSIESTGGKEVHDVALPRADLRGMVLALGILAPADMAWLWERVVGVAREHHVVAGGDSACAFANTAMQLAHQRMIPEVLAATVRTMSAVRSLVAFEMGATGPSKDCAYEGPVLKAITGCPISMEGRSATCAHLSPVGNIAAAMADLWSNESVANVALLSGPAPVASLESLIYDCRLMNAATQRNQAAMLRDLHVLSDAALSPQAAVLTPAMTMALAEVICRERDPFSRVVAAGRFTVEQLRKLVSANELSVARRERDWLGRLAQAFEQLPPDADALLRDTRERYGSLYDAGRYGLPVCGRTPAHAGEFE